MCYIFNSLVCRSRIVYRIPNLAAAQRTQLQSSTSYTTSTRMYVWVGVRIINWGAALGAYQTRPRLMSYWWVAAVTNWRGRVTAGICRVPAPWQQANQVHPLRAGSAHGAPLCMCGTRCWVQHSAAELRNIPLAHLATGLAQAVPIYRPGALGRSIIGNNGIDIAQCAVFYSVLGNNVFWGACYVQLCLLPLSETYPPKNLNRDIPPKVRTVSMALGVGLQYVQIYHTR